MSDILIPDISEFQGTVDWSNLGSEVAIVRLCYGDLHVDAQADRNIDGARSKCAARGWYCYLVAGRDPVAQANTFARILLAHGGLRPNEFVVVDDEESNGANEVGRINAFLDRCDSALNDKSDWWYSGLNFAVAHNLEAAQGHRWIAAYMPNEPNVPHELWQFTSSGSMAGIPGPADLSIFHGSVADFIRLINGTSEAGATDHSGGTMVIIPAPFDPGRLDLLVVGTDGNLYQTFSSGGVGGLDNISFWKNWGSPNNKPIQVGTLGACWDNLNRLCVVAACTDHVPYLICIRSTDGGVDQGWTALNALVGIPTDQVSAGPVGPSGPPGATYDDTDVKNRLSALEGFEAKIKAAIS